MGCTNHTWPISTISRHWLLMPLGAQTHTYTDTHTDAQAKMISSNQALVATKTRCLYVKPTAVIILLL